jgi:photosystem II stability/assembly factor-like uncharacterized protein
MRANRIAEATGKHFHKLCIALLFISFSLSRLGADYWLQDDWSGGPGQQMWNDPTMYLDGEGVEGLKSSGDLALYYPFWRKIGIDTSFNVSVVYDLVEIGSGFLLAACKSNSGGKILRSSDYGNSWNEIYDFPEVIACRSFLLSNNGLLYCGTDSDSGYIYRSDDSGFSWIETAKFDDATKINTLLEASDGKIFAGTGWNGNIFYSQNAGTTWTKVTPAPSLDVWSLRSDSQGRIYACCGSIGGLYRSTDTGMTWDTLLMGSIYIPDVLVDYDENLITNMATWYILKSIDDGFSWDTVFINPIDVAEFMQSQDSSIYAGGCKFYLQRGEVSLYKSIDLGYNWTLTGGLSGSGMILSIIQASDDLLYCGGEISMDGSIFRSSFCDSGYVVSSVFDTQDSSLYGTMDWNATLNGGILVIKARTSQDSLMNGAMSWELSPPVSNGQDISSLVSVNDGDRYIQYFAKLSSSNIYATPILYSILVNYSSASIEENEKDDIQNRLKMIRIVPNPCGSTVKILISFENSLPCKENLELEIYDISGKVVKSICFNAAKKNEEIEITWHGDDMKGKFAPSGIYYIRLRGDQNRKSVSKILKISR